MTPAVSVCVPTYNGAQYLIECLESVLAQTVHDFELLIVDDCSSDGTMAIAESYAARDARVRVFRNEQNLGLVGNWNRCVELSRGEWIKFVFQDDLIAPTCLERMLEVAATGFDMVSCARDFFFHEGTESDTQVGYLCSQRNIARLFAEKTTMTAREFSLHELAHTGVNFLGEPTAMLLRRNVFDRFGLFNPSLIHDCDNEYWARVGTNVGTAYLRDILATFRVHAQSTSAVNNGVRLARKRIDQLVILHDVAFHPEYAALRAIAKTVVPEPQLESVFWNTAYMMLFAGGVASLMRRAGGTTAGEFERLCVAYPRLVNIPLKYRVRGVLRRIVKGARRS